MKDLSGYLIVGGVAAVVTAIMTPLVAMFARKHGFMATPDERRSHPEATPDIGGVAFFIALVAAVFVAWQMDRFDPLFKNNSELVGVVVAGLVVFILGLVDDIHEVSAPMKVTGVVVAAVALIWFGVTMIYFRAPFVDVFVLSSDWIPLFTVLWLLGMTQAINLIDGLDGLAAGIVAIASMAFFVYSRNLGVNGFLSEPNIGPLVAIITVGICVGFLPFNFNPAKIFMGDSGALLLGLLVAVSTSVVGGRANPDTTNVSGQTYFFLAPLFIPILVLGVPILDVIFAIIRRTRSGVGFATADTGHLHHRLIKLGHGPRRAVAIMWLWTALLSGFVLYPTLSDGPTNLWPFLIVAFALGGFTLFHDKVWSRKKDSNQVAS
ncbi:MAG: undecaprenyl/decaprenyl-phosphate alpha-N-acetylglucosaminyl 1-phosphate transferase [Acidimicrobiia bacterium]|nr:undecaprenyl/decaprenyl-phosphate alpha-N-acetylglucosaminyl 1-phosphate transferase [Acidimicrobiia bacterium]NDD72404.1 undecaprenyl/decaprenyl-phosphate alpha-N-acetylglucosaminyl 1-phosphate transferase [Actinomycetota bacterium]